MPFQKGIRALKDVLSAIGEFEDNVRNLYRSGQSGAFPTESKKEITMTSFLFEANTCMSGHSSLSRMDYRAKVLECSHRATTTATPTLQSTETN